MLARIISYFRFKLFTSPMASITNQAIGVQCADDVEIDIDVPEPEEEEPDLPEDKYKELMANRIRPVFPTRRYRKVVTRNPRSGEWEVTYLLKRKKTWTAQSQAGFKKACMVRAEKCKQRKQQRMEEQIGKLQTQLQELRDAAEDSSDSELESDSEPTQMDQEIAASRRVTPPTEKKRAGMVVPDAPKKKRAKN
jgi:hypothetical protein